MGGSARPVPADTTQGTDPQGVPNVPRILSPDEFEQARMLSPEQLGKAKFPVLPPPYAPKEATRAEGPVNPPSAESWPGLTGILTRQVVEPIIAHPFKFVAAAGATALFPPLGYLWAGMMGKDVLEYSAQKAAEMSLPPDIRAQAEKDPDRISGEQAGTEAVMLGAGGALKAGATALRGVAGGEKAAAAEAAMAVTRKTAVAATEVARGKIGQHVDAVTDAWNTIFAPANRGPEAKAAANILRATTGEAAAQYEQAAFKLDDFRRAIDPLPEADKLGFIDNIEGGKTQVSPEFQKAADAIRKTLDDARAQVQNLGTGKFDAFIQDYFPHIWEDPKRAALVFKEPGEPQAGAAPTTEADIPRPRTASGRLKALARATPEELANEYAMAKGAAGKSLYRYGNAADATNPQGAYFSLLDKEGTSPHEDLGPVVQRGTQAAKNPLEVPETTVEHARFGRGKSGEADSGVSALKMLQPQEFERLRTASKADLVKELSEKFPGPDYTRYHDSYDLLSVYGAQEARAAGHDAIVLHDQKFAATTPEWKAAGAKDFSEYVALHPDAIGKQSDLTTKIEAELTKRGIAHDEALAQGTAALDAQKAAKASAGAQADAGEGKTPLEQAKISTGGKRPMEGSRAFLKQRTIPTTAEGIAMGLKPVSTNPVDLTLLKLYEMQRYVMAHQSLHQVRDAGLVKYVVSGDAPPDGYRRIDDKIATVFGPRTGAVTLPEGAVQAVSQDASGAITHAQPVNPEDVQVTGTRIMGQYYAPEPVARIVNNYLSPGLRGNAIFDAYRGFGNTLNQAQLGLSAFHVAFTSLDAIVSKTALGLEYLHQGVTTGDMGAVAQGAKHLALSPTAPFAALAQGTVGDLLNHFAGTDIQMGLGSKIRAAYLDPANASPDMRALANAVKEAGGRVRQDSYYSNSAPEKMMTALRAGEYGKATALSVPALLEGAAKPIMEHIVPLQKLQVFGEMAQKVLADLPPDAPLADRRAALSTAWDNVDNRMGQLVYDNLFWNKTFKDLMMGGQRSVGWNLGIVRGAAGGTEDIAAMAKATLTPGEHGVLTNRAAYLFALPLTVGLYGAIYQYLRTGKGPEELKDYFNPKTGDQDADGNDERVRLPSYTNDAQSVASHPVQTVLNKLAPLPAAMIAMLGNKDFYGDEIRNADDPAMKQIAQEVAYVAKEFEPFALRNMQEQSGRAETTTATKLGNWFGIKPAPREVIRTPAQNEMADIAGRRSGSRTPEEADAAQARATLLAALRDPKHRDVQAAVTDAIERHGVTAPQIGKLLKEAGTSPAQERFKTLTVAQAIDVFKKSTPREQAMFGELLLKKVEAAASRGSP